MTATAFTPCHDCGTDTLSSVHGVSTEYYMVHDYVWAAAGMPFREPACGEYLCIGCLETRLGRKLHRGDFTGSAVNDAGIRRTPAAPHGTWRSKRLAARLTAPAPWDAMQLALWRSPGGEA